MLPRPKVEDKLPWNHGCGSIKYDAYPPPEESWWSHQPGSTWSFIWMVNLRIFLSSQNRNPLRLADINTNTNPMVVAWPTLVRAKYPRDLEWRDVPCALPRYHRSLPFEGPSADLHLSRKECHLSKQKKPSCPIICRLGGPLPVGLNHPAPPTKQKTVDSSSNYTSPYFSVCSNPYQLIILAPPFMARYWLREFAENSLWWRKTSVLSQLQVLAGLIQPKSRACHVWNLFPGDCCMSLWIR